MKQIYTMAKYAKSIMLAAILTVGATVVNAQEEVNTKPIHQQKPTVGGEAKK